MALTQNQMLKKLVHYYDNLVDVGPRGSKAKAKRVWNLLLYGNDLTNIQPLFDEIKHLPCGQPHCVDPNCQPQD